MTEPDYTSQLKARTKQLAIEVLKLFATLPRTPQTQAIETRLVHAVTALAASCRAADRVGVEQDRMSLLATAATEADDVGFWLELLGATDVEDRTSVPRLLDETADIIAILSNHVTTASSPDSPADAPPADAPDRAEAPQNDFGGLRVVAFESRMATEMARLIERYKGSPVVAPALREAPIPLQDNGAVFRLGAKLMLEQIDLLVLMTGTGTKALFDLLQLRYPLGDLTAAVKKTIVVARGPKPVAALKKLNLEANITVPEPNTWVDLVSTLDEYRPVKGLRVVVQEYGMPNPDLIEALTQRGADVFSVPIYRWALPDDLGPLKQALHEILNDQISAMVITNAAQIDHVMQLVAQEGRTAQFKLACKKMVVASIGPSATERLKLHELPVDFEPSHAKMGVLVKELAENIHTLIGRKR
jgi:uroporphyrinogen-III synthase